MTNSEYRRKWIKASYETMGWRTLQQQTDKEQNKGESLSGSEKAVIKPKSNSEQSQTSVAHPFDD